MCGELQLSNVFFVPCQNKNPLIPPKNFKKDNFWQNNVFYQFCIKMRKKVLKNHKMHLYQGWIQPDTFDLLFYRSTSLLPIGVFKCKIVSRNLAFLLEYHTLFYRSTSLLPIGVFKCKIASRNLAFLLEYHTLFF